MATHAIWKRGCATKMSRDIPFLLGFLKRYFIYHRCRLLIHACGIAYLHTKVVFQNNCPGEVCENTNDLHIVVTCYESGITLIVLMQIGSIAKHRQIPRSCCPFLCPVVILPSRVCLLCDQINLRE